MAKKQGLKTWQKVALIGGAGLGIYAIYSAMQPKETTAPEYLPPPADNYTPPTSGTTAPAVTPPTTTTTTPATNYELLKQYLKFVAGVPYLEYGDRIESNIFLSGKQRKLQFYTNNRFNFQEQNPTDKKYYLTNKGNYTNGGKVLTITEGYKAGQIKNGSDVLVNIKNAIA